MNWRQSFLANRQQEWVDALNLALGAAATFNFFAGTIPGSCTDPDSGTEVAENPLSSTPFQNVSAGSSFANAITDDTNTVAGTVTYFRCYDTGRSNVIFQGTCGLSSEDIVFDDNDFANGDTCRVTSFELAIGAGPP